MLMTRSLASMVISSGRRQDSRDAFIDGIDNDTLFRQHLDLMVRLLISVKMQDVFRFQILVQEELE